MSCPNCGSIYTVEEADDLQVGEDDQDTVLLDYNRCIECNCKWVNEQNQIILIESGNTSKRSDSS